MTQVEIASMWAKIYLKEVVTMLRRKVVALCLVLVFALGTGTALAATLDSNPPSDALLRMTARANETIVTLTEMAQEAGDKIVDLQNQHKISGAMADSMLQLICQTLERSTEFVLAPVKAQANREGVSYSCVMMPFEIGDADHIAYVDPIYVPGNAD